VERRMFHCRFFIDFCLWATSILSCLRRILYLLWEAPSCRQLRQPFRSAQAKFVVCDYTIENRLHYRRDVTLGEDQSQLRKGTAPRTLAVLNSVLLSCTDFLGVSNVAEQIRVFHSQPLLAARVLLGSLLTFK
jgi:hypothetical protein